MRLNDIILQKQQETNLLHKKIDEYPHDPLAKVLRGEMQPKQRACFKDALKAEGLSIIAEIKRRSPSKGTLAEISNPIQLAERYISGECNALSILTDEKFFGGHMKDLTQVATALPTIPILRKDFIIDKIQIAQSYLAGASAVLLIVSVLQDQLKPLLEYAHALQLDALVEIHDQAELKVALDCGANMIGVNNRNLNTFTVDTEHAFQIIANIPSNIIKVAESGITQESLARRYFSAGFDAVLIGEALVKSGDPESFIRECRYG